MAGQHIGYIRVSTTAQNTDRQLEGRELDRVFEDKVSGKSADRPQLKALMAHLRSGDTLHVHSIDRLARNLADLLLLIETITGKGVAVLFQKEALTFTGDDSPMQNMMLQLMGAVAQFERSMINERAAEGREAAKAKGVQFGRKPKLTVAQMTELADRRGSGESVSRLAIDFDVSRQAVYRALAR
jgi:DNA invertase Pin-like site-specific DNA recombinase